MGFFLSGQKQKLPLDIRRGEPLFKGLNPLIDKRLLISLSQVSQLAVNGTALKHDNTEILPCFDGLIIVATAQDYVGLA